jgi:hypothetical protein
MLLALRKSTYSLVFFSRLHHEISQARYLQFGEKALLLWGTALVELIILCRVPHGVVILVDGVPVEEQVHKLAAILAEVVHEAGKLVMRDSIIRELQGLDVGRRSQ